ncbi:MAG TPA: sigma 54-interacting transcriptional regulator [Thermoanaerobaculia bacterium]|nr:sigma 54-interacting transcriptional regulator [Thermoanaerobaculia bacterium]
MNPSLVCLSGPLAGQTFPVGAEALSIGRHSSNRLQLPDLAVSRHHCTLEPADGRFLLRDLGSRRGTFVNGLPVQERALEEGDLVTLGGSLFLFQTGDPRSGSGPAVLLGAATPTAETTILLSPEDALYSRPGEVLAALASDRSGRTARDLHALLQAGTALQPLRSTEALARKLLELALSAVPADRATLLLADRGTAELAGAFALDRQGSEKLFPVSQTLAGRVMEERRCLLAADLLEEPDLQSLIAVPLLHLDQPLGLLYLDTRELGRRFDEGHLQLVTALAGIASGALATVRRIEWLEEENRRLAAGFAHDMVGESPRMREIYRLLNRVAATDSTVLLLGESGTGKELAARALHRASPRAERPFVAVNCATLSETLLESELFGHERGAFTGAVSRKTGKVEAADTGTLFLDEVGEIPLPLQAKLLRFLQEREFERLGSTRPLRVDVRVVAATNRNLEKEARAGTFREDLYYRLNVISLYLPPLRERREDIPLLASHFAAQTSQRLGRPVAGFTPEARAALVRYDWPGNVRELANAVERAIVLGEDDLIRPEDLPEAVLETGGTGEAAVTRYHETLNETKKRLILAALAESGGNVTKAGALLGLHPNYLHRLISNLGLRV